MVPTPYPTGYGEAYVALFRAVTRGARATITGTHRLYTKHRIHFRFNSWWIDTGLDLVRQHHADRTGRPVESDQSVYEELYEAGRRYAVLRLTYADRRKSDDLLKPLRSDAENEQKEHSFDDLNIEMLRLRTTLASAGINTEKLIDELRHP